MRKERGSFLVFLQICFSEGYSEGKAKQISDHVSVSEGYKALWRGKTRSRWMNLLEGLKQLFRYGLRKKSHVCGWGPALWQLERRAPTTHQPGMEDMEPPLQPITFSQSPQNFLVPSPPTQPSPKYLRYDLWSKLGLLIMEQTVQACFLLKRVFMQSPQWELLVPAVGMICTCHSATAPLSETSTRCAALTVAPNLTFIRMKPPKKQ